VDQGRLKLAGKTIATLRHKAASPQAVSNRLAAVSFLAPTRGGANGAESSRPAEILMFMPSETRILFSLATRAMSRGHHSGF
jgi:hypothetical protein